MPDLFTTDLSFKEPTIAALQHKKLQVYNGLDNCVTREVHDRLNELLEKSPAGQLIYQFEKALQAPALEMSLRGILTDEKARSYAITDLRKRIEHIDGILQEYAQAVWDKPLNPRSPKQLKDFFYVRMGLPEQKAPTKGVWQVSTNRDALEKLSAYFHAEPIVNAILKIKDLGAKLAVLETEIDGDGRLRFTTNLAGTETGRWSTSKSAMGSGRSVQNITEELRHVFVADPGWKMAYPDLEQAESFALAWVCWLWFGASKYLDACEAGDLHTEVAKLVWPSLGWTGNLKKDRALADTLFYRTFSYRDLAKRGGHGTNYYGKPPTVARHLKVATAIIEEFQFAYFDAFPELRLYHTEVARLINLNQVITTPLGRERQYFGNPGNDTTLREAIASIPQSMVADLVNLAVWRIWHKLRPRVRLLAQEHDAILMLYREEEEKEILPLILKELATPFYHRGRTMTIPSDLAVGWNWMKEYTPESLAKDKAKNAQNPRYKPKPLNVDGLRKYKDGDDRRRVTYPATSRLDRQLLRIL